MLLKKKHQKVFDIDVFILGNQKSGTTIISKLIEQYAGIETLHDFSPIHYKRLSALSSGELTFEQFLKKAKKPFRKHRIIKEPQLTFSIDAILHTFPNTKVLLITRDPRDNIRSILNRLELRGDLKTVNIDELPIIDAWKAILHSKNIGITSTHYIENLANRWNQMYLNYKKHSDQVYLVRYEDFLDDKEGVVHQVCASFGLKQKNDISDKVDIQYQGKGNRDVSYDSFFGEENLSKIEQICQAGMKDLDYL